MKRILFVEDEPRGINPYFHYLEQKDCVCVAAHNADEAVRHLRHEKFDLLSLDVMFDPGRVLAGGVDPQRSGVRILEMIRQAQIPNCNPSLKVIVLTAVQSAAVEDKMKSLGVLEYLKKPVLFDKVIAAYLQALFDTNSNELTNSSSAA